MLGNVQKLYHCFFLALFQFIQIMTSPLINIDRLSHNAFLIFINYLYSIFLRVLAPPKLEHAETYTHRTSLLYPTDDKFEDAAVLFVSGDNIGPYNFTAPPGMSLRVDSHKSEYNDIPTTNYHLRPTLDVKEDTDTDTDTGPTCDKLRRPSGLYHFWFTNNLINHTFQLDVYCEYKKLYSNYLYIYI